MLQCQHLFRRHANTCSRFFLCEYYLRIINVLLETTERVIGYSNDIQHFFRPFLRNCKNNCI